MAGMKVFQTFSTKTSLLKNCSNPRSFKLNFSSQQKSTLGKFFDQQVEKFEHRDAIHVQHENLRLTFKEIQTISTALANGLHEFDFKPGSRLLLTLPNGSAQVISQVGAAFAGVQLVMTQPNPSFSQLDTLLKHTGTRGVILNHSIFTPEKINTFFPETRDLAPGIPFRSFTYSALKNIFVDGQIGIFGTNQFYNLFSYHLHSSYVPEIQQKLSGTDPILQQVYLNNDNIEHEASLTHQQILNTAQKIKDKLELTLEDRVCLGLPLYSNKALAIGPWACISSGCFSSIPSSIQAQAIIQAIERDHCNILITTPEAFNQFKSEKAVLSQIKKVLLVGTSPAVASQLKSLGAGQVISFDVAQETFL